MSKEAFYFPHDYEAIGDPKCLLNWKIVYL